jgi:AcrR family transcriptional regulator
MPKLTEPTLLERRLAIERAALGEFTRRGFHATGLREIAQAAGMSLAGLYAHYDSKEALFRALLSRLYAEFCGPETPIARFFASPAFPDDIEAFGLAIGEMVTRFRGYLLLVFVDVVEFRGRHIALHYRDLVPRFRALLGPRFAALERAGRLGGVDPATAFAAIYMQFFNYFMVERLFGVRRHFGAPDREVVARLAALFRNGLSARKEQPCASPGSRRSSSRASSRASPRPAARSRRRRSPPGS